MPPTLSTVSLGLLLCPNQPVLGLVHLLWECQRHDDFANASAFHRLFKRLWNPTNTSAVNWDSTVCRSPGLSGQWSAAWSRSQRWCGVLFRLTQLSLYRSVFRDNHGALDRESRFSPLFKQESNKITVDDLVKLVSEYRRWSLSEFLNPGRTVFSILLYFLFFLCVCRAEKTSKLQTIPGTLDIAMDYVPMEHPSASDLPSACAHLYSLSVMVIYTFSTPLDCVTSSYVPVRPFEELSKHQPTVEVEEFVQDSTKFTQPHRVYRNHIYVYPKHLKYDSQKSFAKVFFFCFVLQL